MASRNDDHLSDIISLVQGSPRKKAEPKSTAVQKKAKPKAKKGGKKAGRKPLSAQNRRSEILIIRLTRTEKGKLRKLAKERHTTLSSFVRKTSIGEEEENIK